MLVHLSNPCRSLVPSGKTLTCTPGPANRTAGVKISSRILDNHALRVYFSSAGRLPQAMSLRTDCNVISKEQRDHMESGDSGSKFSSTLHCWIYWASDTNRHASIIKLTRIRHGSLPLRDLMTDQWTAPCVATEVTSVVTPPTLRILAASLLAWPWLEPFLGLRNWFLSDLHSIAVLAVKLQGTGPKNFM